ATQFSPTPWLGWIEWIGVTQAFIFFWVLSNNVRTRAHLWTLIVMAISSSANAIFISFYQFFQNPNKMADPRTDYGLRLSESFSGQATGSFADPHSHAVFLLVLLPCFVIAGSVPRLPKILRVLCIYISVIFVASLFFTQIIWPLLVLSVVTVLVCWFAFQKVKRRLAFITFGLIAITVVSILLFVFSPPYKRSFENAMTFKGEGVRVVLAQEAARIFSESPLLGAGAGSFEQKFEQSPNESLSLSPLSPHNDYMLIAANYGLIGILLAFCPAAYGLIRAYQAWRNEPFKVKLKGRKGTTMPPQRFFLSVGISGVIVFGLCSAFSFTWYVPALIFLGAFFFGMTTKSAFSRTLVFPQSIFISLAYALIAIAFAVVFFYVAAPKLDSYAKTLRAEQRLAHVLEQRVHISGNARLLDDIILLFEEAVALDPQNADAWLGLSASTCQLYYRDPANGIKIGDQAITHAESALTITEDYWQAWAQLGITQGLNGDLEAMEVSLRKALELAPNSSNANFYWAAFLSTSADNTEVAIEYVERALAINPENAAARRLQQKLLIL
ncbi:MAG: O-antigen ligase family protein, partial [Verrucomicrobiota bacterium]